jgi:hypothetical protein
MTNLISDILTALVFAATFAALNTMLSDHSIETRAKIGEVMISVAILDQMTISGPLAISRINSKKPRPVGSFQRRLELI